MKAGALTGAAVAAMCGCAASTTGPTDVAAPAAHPSPVRPTCGPEGSAFDLALASNAHGESTPERAVLSFARGTPSFHEPLTGWRLTRLGDDGAMAQSGNFELSLVRLRDGTWLVQGGGCR